MVWFRESGVLVLAVGAVGAPAGAWGDLAELEVSLHFASRHASSPREFRDGLAIVYEVEGVVDGMTVGVWGVVKDDYHDPEGKPYLGPSGPFLSASADPQQEFLDGHRAVGTRLPPGRLRRLHPHGAAIPHSSQLIMSRAGQESRSIR